MLDPVKVPLVRAIEAHGEKLKELTLREPNGGDIMKCGQPFTIDITAEGAVINPNRPAEMGAMISECAGIPPSSVKALTVIDFLAATAAIVNFIREQGRET